MSAKLMGTPLRLLHPYFVVLRILFPLFKVLQKWLYHAIRKKYSHADKKKSRVETNLTKVFITYNFTANVLFPIRGGHVLLIFYKDK